MASEPASSAKLSSAMAFGLLMVIAFSWGLSWPVNKAVLSYVSPLARSLIGKAVGDEVRMGSVEAEIVAIE